LLLLWQCSASLLSFEITMREISPHQSVKNTGCGIEQAPSNVPRPLEIDSSIMLVNILRLGSSLLARIFVQLPRSSQVRQRHQENLVSQEHRPHTFKHLVQSNFSICSERTIPIHPKTIQPAFPNFEDVHAFKRGKYRQLKKTVDLGLPSVLCIWGKRSSLFPCRWWRAWCLWKY
jgi:hypothetical protein